MAIVDLLADKGAAPHGFEPGHSWIPLVAAVGGGIAVAQLAVIAAARRAGRVRPAEALREVAIEHGRPGATAVAQRHTVPGRRWRDGDHLLRRGSSLRSRSSAASCSRRGPRCSDAGCSDCPPLRSRGAFRLLGAPGLLASTSLAANRWRTGRARYADRADRHARRHPGRTPDQRTAAHRADHRVHGFTADHVVVGDDGAPLPAGTARQGARLPRSTLSWPCSGTEVFLLEQRARLGHPLARGRARAPGSDRGARPARHPGAA